LKRDDLFSRYRLARPPEEKKAVIREMEGEVQHGGEEISGGNSSDYGNFNGAGDPAKECKRKDALISNET